MIAGEPGPEILDAELLRRVSRRDRQAFSVLYDRFSTTLFSVTVAILKNESEAEEVLQDVFVNIWKQAGTFDPNLGRALGWAVALARNRSIDRLRSKGRSRRMVDAVRNEMEGNPGAFSLSSDPVVDAERASLVRETLQRLPPNQREAIQLAYFTGMTQSEIANSLDLPLGTVKARIRRGMVQLRKALQKFL